MRTHRMSSPGQMKFVCLRTVAFHSILLSFVALMASAVGFVQSAGCQTLYGAVTGNVMDPNGRAVPGATVTVTQTDTNNVRTTTTNNIGLYSIVDVPPGPYRIVISKPGFATSEAQNIEVKFNAVSRIDVTLKVGSTSETVTVDAESAQLQTDRTDVNTQIAAQEFQNLPQPTRTYEGLLGAVAGVGTPSAGGLGTNNPDRSFAIQANGTSTSSTDVRIEGVSAPDPWVPFFSSLTPSVDAIESVSMVTAAASADQQLASGATINVQLKSGTNQFHGSAYWYHIDNLFAAQPYFNPSGSPLPPNVDNNPGGTLGGPIIKNKAFFFGSYEGDFDYSSYVSTDSVPTAAMMQGDFSATGTTIYDPNTGNSDGTGRTPFQGNRIPQSRISSNVVPLLSRMALVKPVNNGFENNVVGVIGTPQTLQKIDTKFDWDTTKKLRLTGRWNYHPYKVQSLPNFGNGAAGFGEVLNAGDHNQQTGNTYATTIAATYTASSNLLIDGTWGFNKTNQKITPFLDNQKFGSDTMKIQGLNLAPLPYGGGVPQIGINGYSGYGYAWPDLQYDDSLYSYAGNVIWNKGTHSVKVGTTIAQTRMIHNELSPDSLYFGGNSTIQNAPGSSPNQFNGVADFLLGLPSSWANSFQPFGKSRLNTAQYTLHATDTWQLNQKITLSYGMGWSYFPIPTHGSYGLENYNLDKNIYQVCGYGGVPMDCGISVPKNLFSPSIGTAYRVANGLVVRGGFSIAREPFNIGRDLIYNYPENIGYSASSLTPYRSVGSLSSGVPTIGVPDYKLGTIPLPAGASFYALPQRIINGYTESFNVTVQKQLGKWLGQAGYVGNTSIHQHLRYNFNYGTVGGGVTSEPLYAINGTTVGEIAIQPYGHTRYDSLQTTLQRDLANGIQFKAAYTYSKWIGQCCDTNGFGGLGTPIPQYVRLNHAVMPGDQKHIFSLTGIAQSPFGPGKSYALNRTGAAILGNWQLGVVLTAFTGPPFTVSADGTSLNAPGSSQRADQVKSHVTMPKSIHQYFDPTAFMPVNQTRFGTAGYDSLYGPGGTNLDASIFRSFALPERVTGQLRFESFNVTNSPHFGSPHSYVSSVQYDSNGNIVNLNGFGQITHTNAIGRYVDSRYFRVGVKLTF